MDKMSKQNIITPRKVKGFWELMPKEQMLFSSLLSKIEEVFKANCFLPLDTPVLEYSEALLAKSGGETDKQVFRFTKGDADICLRYDLTVPLARFVAMHQNELNFPFKRYQIGKVYRGERPQKGRLREFYQCDADIIGDGELSLIADAECVNLLEKCFNSLNLEPTIYVSNRKILAGFIQDIQKENRTTDILIVLDKLSKIPEEEAKAELAEIGLNQSETEKIIKLTKMSGNIAEISHNLCDFCKNDLFQQGLKELQEVDAYLKDLGSKAVTYNLSVIRGHNYYTGIVFETFIKNHTEAVGGGGRFENLCSYFSEKKMIGVGMSVGITRLFDLLMSDDYFDLSNTSEIDVAIINFDDTLSDSLKIMQNLRENSVKAEILSESKTFKAKMKEANRRQIKYVLIVGSDEVASKKYTLKDMQTGTQLSLSLEEIAKVIKQNNHTEK